MDAFEELVAGILRAEGFWVEANVRVKLRAADKRALNNYSMPHPEVDLVAYRPGTGELVVVECKSYFDSGGVHARDLNGGGNAQRYKMFVNDALRAMVMLRLVDQMKSAGRLFGDPVPQLGLAYGYATPHNERELQKLFAIQGWRLIGPEQIRRSIIARADEAYDNRAASMMAKLFLREITGRPSRSARGNVAEAAEPICQ